MRHGKTVWNEKHITQGRTNNMLSIDGKSCCQTIAKQYKDVQIDAIVCSPLRRAVQTANIMNRYHSAKIIKDDLLVDIDQGIFTGRCFDTLTEDEKAIKASKSKNAKMESYEMLYSRMQKFVDSLKVRYPYKTILVVTHSGCASFIEDIILNKRVDFAAKNYKCNFDNNQVKEFEI